MPRTLRASFDAAPPGPENWLAYRGLTPPGYMLSPFVAPMSIMLTAQLIIERLRLEPLRIEGGYFRETYRSKLRVPAEALPETYGGERNVSTAIYYLLTPETFSAIHRVKSDEVFHFYAGDPVEMLQLRSDGRGETILIGNDLAAEHVPQVVVPAGVWQGCRLIAGGRWALMGCTVAPGFDYADFEAGSRTELVALYPEFTDLIAALTTNFGRLANSDYAAKSAADESET